MLLITQGVYVYVAGVRYYGWIEPQDSNNRDCQPGIRLYSLSLLPTTAGRAGILVDGDGLIKYISL